MPELDVKTFGIMLGCAWGSSVLVLGLMSMMSVRGAGMVKLFARVYIGYGPTPLRSFIGAAWGFIDGAVSGIVIAWVYNKLVS
jgi:hypothetical protein